MAHNSANDVGRVAVADRASGSISIIDTQTDTLRRTVALPAGENPSEPMYVVYKENRLYVGDRANNRIVVFDSYGLNVLKSISAGNGVFHMWAAKNRQLLLVNNDVDNTVTVIDTNTLSVLNTLAIPYDLVAMGYKPHDIFVSHNGKAAFVSLVDGQSGDDYVIKLSIKDGKELRRTMVGGDPHLFIAPSHKNTLYVASQNSGSVAALNANTLVQRHQFEVPNAHGIFAHGRQLYVTNIAEGGVQGIYAIDGKKKRVIGTEGSPYAVPHNLVVTNNGQKIYVTHSGGNQNKVSVYLVKPGKQPRYSSEITVSFNPFGLAYIPH